jgi:hypothetical protein
MRDSDALANRPFFVEPERRADTWRPSRSCSGSEPQGAAVLSPRSSTACRPYDSLGLRE